MSGAKVYVWLRRAERHVRCEELIGTAACLTLYTWFRVNRCRYNRVRLFLSLWVKASDRIRSSGSLKDAFVTFKSNVTGRIKLTSSAHSWLFSSSSMKSYAFYDPSVSSFVSKILPIFFVSRFFYWLLLCFMSFIMLSLFLFFNRYRSNVEFNTTARSVVSGPLSSWNRRTVLQFFTLLPPNSSYLVAAVWTLKIVNFLGNGFAQNCWNWRK
jgi:hypothetical protein